MQTQPQVLHQHIHIALWQQYGSDFPLPSSEIFLNFLFKYIAQMFLCDPNPKPLSSATQVSLLKISQGRLCTDTGNRHYFSYVALESALGRRSAVVLILKGNRETLNSPSTM